MIDEGSAVIDVGDLRALYSLVTNTGTESGIFLAAGAFTPRAYEWAAQRSIRLVDAEFVEELKL
jgi:hypothetical protein